MPARDEHINLLFDISELSHMVSDSTDIDHFLSQVVLRVADHLKSEVGSVYLLDEYSQELVLKATVGLNPQSVGRIRMKIGEGLVGTAMAQMQPICDGAASDNPRFKYFEEAHEDPYKSFLAVPISRNREKIGVLVVQHRQSDFFTPADVMGLRAIASQLAGTIANARVMLALRTPVNGLAAKTEQAPLRFIKGEASVSGFAVGPAVPLKPVDPLLSKIPDEEFHDSIKMFHRAVDQTIEQLKQYQDQLVRRLPESAALIFEAHYMILKDPRFVAQVAEKIRNGYPAVRAVREVARHFIGLFESSANAYIREKTHDIEDLTHRIINNLRIQRDRERESSATHIVIASQLYPSDILKLASESVAGLILVSGGVASHVTIIARSLRIPTIIASHPELLQIEAGTPVLMDAYVGTIHVNPSEEVLRQYRKVDRNQTSMADRIPSMRSETRTHDGVQVNLFANINLLSEVPLARDLKAEGVGLYRSEFPFIVRSGFPSEEEQRLVYEQLIRKMEGKPIYIRTLDIGGDKILPYLNVPQEANPELGLRSIRFSLQHPEIFKQQLRAILRAGVHAPQLHIMFPMISSVDEFETARAGVTQTIAELANEGFAHHQQPAIGAMIELPAVVDIMDDLALRADFFSIGTNDFIQYMLAVDRTNENVAHYYEPYHPGVLRALARIVRISRRHGKPICVCGEVAHDPDYIPFLLGIGVRRLSLDPQFLPVVQRCITETTIAGAEKHALELLACGTRTCVEKVREARSQSENRHLLLNPAG